MLIVSLAPFIALQSSRASAVNYLITGIMRRAMRARHDFYFATSTILSSLRSVYKRWETNFRVWHKIADGLSNGTFRLSIRFHLFLGPLYDTSVKWELRFMSFGVHE